MKVFIVPVFCCGECPDYYAYQYSLSGRRGHDCRNNMVNHKAWSAWATKIRPDKIFPGCPLTNPSQAQEHVDAFRDKLVQDEPK